jgi:ABC-type nitrate/sulfonate/bicarbonate transport system, permease component
MCPIFEEDDDARIAKHLNLSGRDGNTVKISSGKSTRWIKTVLTFVIGIIIVLLIWQIFAWYENEIVGKALIKFPTPLDTFGELWNMLTLNEELWNHSIYTHISASLERWAIAFILAAIVGVALGSLLGYVTSIYSIGMVPVSVFQMIPGLAWIPIAALLLGFGNEAAIFIIFAVSSVTITVSVAGGIRRTPQVVHRAAKMMGAGSAIMFLKILLPYATVDIVNGLRLGMASAWRVLIAAEMLVPIGIGLGYAMSMLRSNFDYVGAFVCITVICAIGLIIDKLIFANIEKYARRKLGMEDDF